MYNSFFSFSGRERGERKRSDVCSLDCVCAIGDEEKEVQYSKYSTYNTVQYRCSLGFVVRAMWCRIWRDSSVVVYRLSPVVSCGLVK
jgi:hypothetical protein